MDVSAVSVCGGGDDGSGGGCGDVGGGGGDVGGRGGGGEDSGSLHTALIPPLLGIPPQ